MLLFADKSFAATVCEMMEKDFAECRLATAAEIASRPFWFHFSVRLARLMAPIQ
jgi:cardiolipin synthase A/B